jgi:acyl carrier protein
VLSPRLIDIATRVFGVEGASLMPETGVGDLDAWDSLGHLRLMMELEHEFNVRFSTEQIRRLTSLAAIQNALPIKG